MKKEFYVYRNKPGYCQFTLDAYDPQAIPSIIQENVYDVVFRRDGNPLFSGQISYITPEITQSDTSDVIVLATGHIDMLQQRMVTPSYPNYDTIKSQLPFVSVDGGQVIMTLINDAQFPLLSDGNISMTGSSVTYCQSFVAPSATTVSTLKLLLQNSTIINGTITSATANSLTDTSQNFSSQLVGATVDITSGLDTVDSQVVGSISGATTLNLYAPTLTGTVSSADSTSLTDNSQTWIPNALIGKVVSINAGTDNGDSATITSNTATKLTISGTWITIPDATSTYSISPSMGTWTLLPSPGDTYTITALTPLTTGNLIIGIYLDNNGLPSNTLVANSQLTIPVSQIPAGETFTWNTFTYGSTPPTVNQGQKYWIKCYLDTAQSIGNAIQWAFMNNDYYSNGVAYSPENPSLFTPQQDLQFFIGFNDNSYQMTVNTYIGLQQGILQTSFPITRSFAQYKKIKEAIEEISQLHNGIDFTERIVIDTNNRMQKFIDVYYPRQGSDKTSFLFTYPGNILRVSKSKDGKAATNKAYIRGQGTGNFQVVTTSFDSLSIEQFGLREDTEDYSDIPDPTILQSIGDEYVKARSIPLETPDIVLDGKKDPQLGTYWLGDTILIQSNGPGLLNYQQTYRIEEIHVTIDDDAYEEIELTLSLL